MDMQSTPDFGPFDTVQPTPERPKQQRTFKGKVEAPDDREPSVRHGEIEGQPVVFVELSGRHGQRREMALFPNDWNRAKKIAKWWVVAIDGTGRNFHVTSGKTQFGGMARQATTTHPRLTLARVLTGAKRGQIVWYRNRNPLDLRRSNLEVITAAEFHRRVRDIVWLMDGMDHSVWEREGNQ